jgi:hypothetical protein
MSTPVSTLEPEIRSLIGEWTEALRAKDVARRTAHYADDVLIFDVINPVQHLGLVSARACPPWPAAFGTYVARLMSLSQLACERGRGGAR